MKNYIKKKIPKEMLDLINVVRQRPDILVPMRFRRSRYRVALSGDRLDATYIFCLNATYGDYLQKIILSLPDDIVFLDIGANLGIFSLLAGKHLRNGDVISFEPNPKTFRYLVDNIERNKLSNISAMNCAIADGAAGVSKLYLTDRHSGGSTMVGSDGRSINIIAIPAILIDGIVAANKDIAIKIDVEGHEISVLKSLSQASFFSRVKWIVLEVSEPLINTSGVAEINRILAASGFKRKSRSSENPHRDELHVRDGSV